MAERLEFGDCDQFHHFVADGVWDAARWNRLLDEADPLSVTAAFW